MRWVFVHSGCPYICLSVCRVCMVWGGSKYVCTILLRHWVCSGEQAEQCATESCGLVHYLCSSTCTSTTQLLAHPHPGHLCSSSHHPTTHLTTCAPQLRGHLYNIYSGFAQPTSTTQACQLGDLVHLHCSHPWSHHPTNLVPLRSVIKHFACVCTAGPTILLKTPVQSLLCLFIEHLLAVFVISVWLDTFHRLTKAW